ncbi:MAG: DUF2878 domain-containing protein [Pseudomonadota bacterium]|nr:DUF2878 domain-containing protein [Pseudomonadota bacterium]MDQ3160473.1 DUF2878 domain-containing protein [Pseudomonadota bacterium]
MRFWANVVGYQLVWFAIVISAARGQPIVGIAVALVFIGLQFHYSTTRSSDARALLVAFLCGFLLDGALVATGWLHYAFPLLSLPAPAWILALWMAFAMTLNHSMAFLRGRPVLAAFLGGIGGPLAYFSAARGFDAVTFTTPEWQPTALLAIGWAIALATLAVLTKRWANHQAVPPLQPEHV